jgi:hypothetical protein
MKKGYFYYFVWIAGMLLLAYYGNQFMDMMANKRGGLGKLDYKLLGQIGYALVFGIYLSLLNGIPNRRKFHRPFFFFIFLPSFILLIYPVINTYVKLPYGSLFADVTKWNGYFYFGLLSGLSFMKSLFGSR